jgi:hypothetical protein
VARPLGALAGAVPFSIGEAAALGLVLGAAAWGWRSARCVRRRARRAVNVLAHLEVNGLALLGLLYAAFLPWGLNYHRTPVAQRAGLDTSPAAVEELAALCEALADETNAARLEVREDEAGVMRLWEPRRRCLARARLGFPSVDRAWAPLAEGYAGKVKALRLLALPMSYLGSDGIFVMVTGEPSVNALLPDPALPFAASHEVAHQIGWAREEEASFVGYLACSTHPDADFRYSGRLAALSHAMAALRGADPDRHRALLERLSPGVRRDREAVRAHHLRFRSPVSEAAGRAYDVYLKSQGQEAGLESYGRVVDLLIASRRRR